MAHLSVKTTFMATWYSSIVWELNGNAVCKGLTLHTAEDTAGMCKLKAMGRNLPVANMCVAWNVAMSLPCLQAAVE